MRGYFVTGTDTEVGKSVLAAVLGPRLGLPADEPAVRLLAATVNAAFRVVTDEVAASGHSLGEHRERLAEALRAREWLSRSWP